MDKHTTDRIDCDRLIEYRVSQTDTFKPGILKNVGDSDVILWLKADISVGETLEIRSDHNFDPVNMYMRVVRIDEARHKGLIGYECTLEIMVNEVA